MSKRKNRQAGLKKTSKAKTAYGHSPLRKWVVKNVVGLILSIGLVYSSFTWIGGYAWLWDNLIVKNDSFIRNYSHLTTQKKYEIKWGFDYSFINFIKKNTQENTILLMPSKADLFINGQKSDFRTDPGGIKNKAWAT